MDQDTKTSWYILGIALLICIVAPPILLWQWIKRTVRRDKKEDES